MPIVLVSGRDISILYYGQIRTVSYHIHICRRGSFPPSHVPLSMQYNQSIIYQLYYSTERNRSHNCSAECRLEIRHHYSNPLWCVRYKYQHDSDVR
jgi:hypothetical protein